MMTEVRMLGEDEQRFRVLFDEHLNAVWRYARRRCPSDAAADDVVTETFAVA
jgi:DNA-directed RNA polymerase specialized sigma24 family protein